MKSLSQHFLYVELKIINHFRPSMNRRKFRLQFTAKGGVAVQKQPAELISSNIKLG